MNKLINYIEKNLELARQAPNRDTAQNWYSQAFGALSFWSYENYEQYPEAEAMMAELKQAFPNLAPYMRIVRDKINSFD